MAPESEEVLRKSLNAVDRQRTRLMWAVAFATMLFFAGFLWVHGGRMGDVRSAIAAAMVVLALWNAALTLLVVAQIAAAAKRILRAIELTSRSR